MHEFALSMPTATRASYASCKSFLTVIPLQKERPLFSVLRQTNL